MNTQNATVILELKGEGTPAPAMRWERTSSAAQAPFELLGRAFEVALRDSDAGLAEALRAFFGGALLHKADVALAIEDME